jgi:hypothetical protein
MLTPLGKLPKGCRGQDHRERRRLFPGIIDNAKARNAPGPFDPRRGTKWRASGMSRRSPTPRTALGEADTIIDALR